MCSEFEEEREQASRHRDVARGKTGMRQEDRLGCDDRDRQSPSPGPREGAPRTPRIEEQRPPEDERHRARPGKNPRDVARRIDREAAPLCSQRKSGSVCRSTASGSVPSFISGPGTSAPPMLEAEAQVGRLVERRAQASRRASRTTRPMSVPKNRSQRTSSDRRPAIRRAASCQTPVVKKNQRRKRSRSSASCWGTSCSIRNSSKSRGVNAAPRPGRDTPPAARWQRSRDASDGNTWIGIAGPMVAQPGCPVPGRGARAAPWSSSPPRRPSR